MVSVFLFLTHFTWSSALTVWPLHLSTSGKISFFSLAESYSTLYISTIFYFIFIHQRTCVHILAISNNAVVNMGVHIYFFN